MIIPVHVLHPKFFKPHVHFNSCHFTPYLFIRSSYHCISIHLVFFISWIEFIPHFFTHLHFDPPSFHLTFISVHNISIQVWVKIISHPISSHFIITPRFHNNLYQFTPCVLHAGYFHPVSLDLEVNSCKVFFSIKVHSTLNRFPVKFIPHQLTLMSNDKSQFTTRSTHHESFKSHHLSFHYKVFSSQ